MDIFVLNRVMSGFNTVNKKEVPGHCLKTLDKPDGRKRDLNHFTFFGRWA